MIKVSAFSDFMIALTSIEDYQEHINHLLSSLEHNIKVEKILSISKPFFKHGTYCANVYARFTLIMPEDEECIKIDDYTGKVLPFLKDHLPLSYVTNVKIDRIQRAANFTSLKMG